MSAVDQMMNAIEGSHVEIRKDGCNFAASIVINNMDYLTAVDKTVDKAMWELNGAIVEAGVVALINRAGLI